MGYQLWDKMSLKIEKAGRTVEPPSFQHFLNLAFCQRRMHQTIGLRLCFHPDGRGKCIHFGLPRVLQQRVP